MVFAVSFFLLDFLIFCFVGFCSVSGVCGAPGARRVSPANEASRLERERER